MTMTWRGIPEFMAALERMAHQADNGSRAGVAEAGATIRDTTRAAAGSAGLVSLNKRSSRSR